MPPTSRSFSCPDSPWPPTAREWLCETFSPLLSPAWKSQSRRKRTSRKRRRRKSRKWQSLKGAIRLLVKVLHAASKIYNRAFFLLQITVERNVSKWSAANINSYIDELKNTFCRCRPISISFPDFPKFTTLSEILNRRPNKIVDDGANYGNNILWPLIGCRLLFSQFFLIRSYYIFQIFTHFRFEKVDLK
jgi:hypothetical protein